MLAVHLGEDKIQRMTEHKDCILACKGVVKEFGEEPVAHVINEVSLSLKRDDFTAIMGPSGSGKSTLLNIIAGLDIPTRGDIIFDGVSYRNLSGDALAELRRKKIGMVHQAFNLLPRKSTLENVAMPLLLDGLHREEAFEAAAYVLGKVGLERHLDKPAIKLSGGEQQRVAIARALVIRPSLILADEPTGNLDSKTGAQFLELLREVRRAYNAAILLVTHNARDAAAANRLVYMEDGKLLVDTELHDDDPDSLLRMLHGQMKEGY